MTTKIYNQISVLFLSNLFRGRLGNRQSCAFVFEFQVEFFVGFFLLSVGSPPIFNHQKDRGFVCFLRKEEDRETRRGKNKFRFFWFKIFLGPQIIQYLLNEERFQNWIIFVDFSSNFHASDSYFVHVW